MAIYSSNLCLSYCLFIRQKLFQYTVSCHFRPYFMQYVVTFQRRRFPKKVNFVFFWPNFKFQLYISQLKIRSPRRCWFDSERIQAFFQKTNYGARRNPLPGTRAQQILYQWYLFSFGWRHPWTFQPVIFGFTFGVTSATPSFNWGKRAWHLLQFSLGFVSRTTQEGWVWAGLPQVTCPGTTCPWPAWSGWTSWSRGFVPPTDRRVRPD